MYEEMDRRDEALVAHRPHVCVVYCSSKGRGANQMKHETTLPAVDEGIEEKLSEERAG